jgi:hypothetical protein
MSTGSRTHPRDTAQSILRHFKALVELFEEQDPKLEIGPFIIKARAAAQPGVELAEELVGGHLASE